MTRYSDFSPPGSPSWSQAPDKRSLKRTGGAHGSDEDMVSRSLPPRRARAKAMDDQVWMQDAPKSKRKRIQAVSPAPDAVDPETEAFVAKKAKADKSDVQARSAKSTAKSSTASHVSSATRVQVVPRLSRTAYEGSDGEAAPSRNAATYRDSRTSSITGRSVPRLSRAAYLNNLDDEPPRMMSNRAASQQSSSLGQCMDPAARKWSQHAVQQQKSRRTSAALYSSDEELIIPGFGAGDAEAEGEDAEDVGEAEERDEWDQLSPRQLEEAFAQERPVWAETQRSRGSAQVSSSPPQPPSPPRPNSPDVPVNRHGSASSNNGDKSRRSRPQALDDRPGSAHVRRGSRDPGRVSAYGTSDDDSREVRADRSSAGDRTRRGSVDSREDKRARRDAQPARSGRTDHAAARQSLKSRAQLAYEQEQPSWQPSDAEDSGHEVRRGSSQTSHSRSQSRSEVHPRQRWTSDTEDEDVDCRDGSVQWPACTRIVLPQGREAFQLTAQSPDIQTLLRKSIKTVEYHLAFVHAFPEPKLKTEFVRQQLLKCAKDLGLREVARRISRDVNHPPSILGSNLFLHLNYHIVCVRTPRHPSTFSPSRPALLATPRTNPRQGSSPVSGTPPRHGSSPSSRTRPRPGSSPDLGHTTPLLGSSPGYDYSGSSSPR
ncbi:uncharacterized protein C8Q71DRAFT_722986 [Rhodofomes roseus]|uniref:Uncharacterized protein n=1 Tax=Rhodofomes roseus TaxID=34475 RepID=A0ABQ8KIM7_9APHY|nr:uncharacterized protein C8Q71DRAFT_722986 [Rhodofomes roseus]KAH9837657.1 hypothetical protein C8Q71DRAFT_722986 [Rhodofomes roseus]